MNLGSEVMSIIEVKIINNLTKEETILKDKTEFLPLPPQDGPYAYTGGEFGFSENLGNFRSAKGKVFLMYPCSPADVDIVYDKVKNWIDKRVEAEFAEVQQYIGNARIDI